MLPVPNSTVYYAIALPVDATFGLISFFLSFVILVLYILKQGWKKPTSFVFMNIALVDLVNSLNSIFHCFLMKNSDNKKLFYSAFFLQAMVLNTSLLFVLLLGLMRILAVCKPFEFASIVKLEMIYVLSGLIWFGSGIDCYLRYDWRPYVKYKVYLTGVILRIILIVITNMVGVATISVLVNRRRIGKDTTAEDKLSVKLQQSASFTASLLSFTFLLCHSYYLYVLLVWTVPGLCSRSKTASPWLYFTGCGGESLSMGHISLLLQSIATNLVILNMQTLRYHLKQVISDISSVMYSAASGSGEGQGSLAVPMKSNAGKYVVRNRSADNLEKQSS